VRGCRGVGRWRRAAVRARRQAMRAPRQAVRARRQAMRARREAVRARRPGMTLIEIVVALTIAAAVVAAGVAAFASITDQRRRAEEVTAEVMRAAAIRETLRAWLAGASLLPGEGGPPFRGIDGIRGDSPDDVLVFLTSARTPLGPGPVLVQLAIDHDDETRERGLVADIVEWRGTARTRVEIEPDAAGLDLRYLSSLRGEPQWLPSWISNTLLPAGIELRIVPADGKEIHPLLARPLLVPVQGG